MGKLNVLHIAKWYPNATDVQNGIFIKKHILSTANETNAEVLFFCECTIYPEPVVHQVKQGIVKEHIVYYHPKSKISTYNLKNRVFKQIIAGSGNPDRIHFHVLSADLFIFSRYAERNRIPYFISEHWSGYVNGTFNGLSKIKQRLIKRIAKKAKVVMPVSTFLMNAMKTSGLKANYQVVPNIVEPSVNETGKFETYTFLMVADLVDEIKNISGVIKAFNAIKSQFKKECQLIIIGDGPDAKQLKTNSSDVIKFLGRLENNAVLEQIAKSHCIIINSNVETFSIVALEAQAAGLNVISTKCGGPEEYANENTILISKNNSKQLSDAMLMVAGRGISYKRDLTPFSSTKVGFKLLTIYA